MARRAPTLDLGAILAGLAPRAQTGTDPEDEATNALLDAASTLLSTYGMRRWSMDDVAEQAGLGRATVYRRFSTRDDLVQAALARDTRRFFAAIAAAVEHLEPIEDKVVEGLLVGMRMVRSSLIPALIRTDTAKALSLLTAAPVLALARAALVDRYQAITRRSLPQPELERAELVAEALVRLGISFVLMPESIVRLDDDEAARRALRQLVGPLLAT